MTSTRKTKTSLKLAFIELPSTHVRLKLLVEKITVHVNEHFMRPMDQISLVRTNDARLVKELLTTALLPFPKEAKTQHVTLVAISK